MLWQQKQRKSQQSLAGAPRAGAGCLLETPTAQWAE